MSIVDYHRQRRYVELRSRVLRCERVDWPPHYCQARPDDALRVLAALGGGVEGTSGARRAASGV